MDTMNERVTAAIRVSGLSASEVGRRLGVSPEAVLQWMNGPTKNIRMAHLFALARVTGYEAEWLGTGEGPARKPAEDLRKKALNTLWDNSDERGKDHIFRVAEAESHYGPGGSGAPPGNSAQC